MKRGPPGRRASWWTSRHREAEEDHQRRRPDDRRMPVAHRHRRSTGKCAAGTASSPAPRGRSRRCTCGTWGTLGGNLCLDTRCNYYNQNYEWRQAISFCMKAPKGTDGHACALPDGTSICWVAPSSPRCWAVSSTDTAPALISLGAEVTLIGLEGARRIPLAELYGDDGMPTSPSGATRCSPRCTSPPRRRRVARPTGSCGGALVRLPGAERGGGDPVLGGFHLGAAGSGAGGFGGRGGLSSCSRGREPAGGAGGGRRPGRQAAHRRCHRRGRGGRHEARAPARQYRLRPGVAEEGREELRRGALKELRQGS